jgi:thioredoxin reductase (NADPH)
MEENSYDVVIIGGGPGGASAAIYTARANLSTLVLDKNIMSSALAVATKIVNYPGVPEEISGLELLRRMRTQAESFGARFVQEQVIGVDFSLDPKTVYTNNVYHAKAVILATGAHERKNKVPGEDELLGRGVSYCATCDAAFFKDEDVAVIGFNDHALEEALFLTRYAKSVKAITPVSEFKASQELKEKAAANDKIEFLTKLKLMAVEGNGSLRAIRVQGREGTEQSIPVTGAFIYLEGNKPSTGFLSSVIPLGAGGCLMNERDQSTPIPGVFAVGDVTCTQLKQAVVSASEGVIAAIAADRFINRLDKTSPGRYY